jgi:hypothetical protein
MSDVNTTSVRLSVFVCHLLSRAKFLGGFSRISVWDFLKKTYRGTLSSVAVTALLYFGGGNDFVRHFSRFWADSVEIRYRKVRRTVVVRFSTLVQAVPGAHPLSVHGVPGSFQGVKRPGRGVNHPLLTHLAPRLKKE